MLRRISQGTKRIQKAQNKIKKKESKEGKDIRTSTTESSGSLPSQDF